MIGVSKVPDLTQDQRMVLVIIGDSGASVAITTVFGKAKLTNKELLAVVDQLLQKRLIEEHKPSTTTFTDTTKPLNVQANDGSRRLSITSAGRRQLALK